VLWHPKRAQLTRQRGEARAGERGRGRALVLGGGGRGEVQAATPCSPSIQCNAACFEDSSRARRQHNPSLRSPFPVPPSAQVVVLDGVAYHQNESGTRVLSGDEPSPFMTVTWFGGLPT
jgi:hypothetical protein